MCSFTSHKLSGILKTEFAKKQTFPIRMDTKELLIKPLYFSLYPFPFGFQDDPQFYI